VLNADEKEVSKIFILCMYSDSMMTKNKQGDIKLLSKILPYLLEF